MSLPGISLGKSQDAGAQTDAIAEGSKFPLVVVLSNGLKKPLVLAQAVPPIFLAQGESINHTCHTRGHLYDIIFGMIAIGDIAGQDTIGSITKKLPRGASKK